MKARISQMDEFPMTLEGLKQVIQDLWDEMDPYKFIKEIQSMPEKCKEVLKQKGLATRYQSLNFVYCKNWCRNWVSTVIYAGMIDYTPV